MFYNKIWAWKMERKPVVELLCDNGNENKEETRLPSKECWRKRHVLPVFCLAASNSKVETSPLPSFLLTNVPGSRPWNHGLHQFFGVAICIALPSCPIKVKALHAFPLFLLVFFPLANGGSVGRSFPLHINLKINSQQTWTVKIPRF